MTATPPSGETVCAGGPVNFSTTAGGSGPFQYQWKKDGSPIPGAVSSSHSIAAVTPGDAGDYTVEDAAIREWYVADGAMLLFITYSCDLDNRGMDDAAVDELLDTLMRT